ncbi:hypothetical protein PAPPERLAPAPP_00700 [Brevundimonas phage vB_BpoS-Papperlapapp]|uniref:Uncharacterized protein n=1 Tax=Brevundimonas phage vB_BpoS-Domovoi TaxID=2948598 RepID=A0A9E7SML3_9CAUD|nr:hypothetical protein DOMOVOI_05470 [Brevundimonas phage vB_BpoS-Domovoi]USN15812.1 hypothetical protein PAPPERLAPAPP_00700 [Brevundimonas phage vB_BpoS-Papperlapapp]
MGLAITIGVVIALTIALILWARGAISAANRRHEAQVRANTAASAARARQMREPSLSIQAVKSDAYRKPTAATYPPARSEIVDFGYVEYGGSSSSSYHSGGSCSSGGSSGGDSGGGGGCD